MACGLHLGSCFGCRSADLLVVGRPSLQRLALMRAACKPADAGAVPGSGGASQPCFDGRSSEASAHCFSVPDACSGLLRRRHLHDYLIRFDYIGSSGCLALLFSATSTAMNRRGGCLVLFRHLVLHPGDSGWSTCWFWHPKIWTPEMWSLAAPPFL